ncbi:MAG: 2,4-dihydroxyhept-2-ene-1,7-dioic acid aldolase [marine bacterium B5-7]|nr:MAG: 2,4-dihydroxyhept-2-ene-1,7-dioic acid aldolase [marine bacterium B5-7]
MSGSFKQHLSRGTKTRGAFLVLGNEIIAEIASNSGFDYAVVDCQHGTFGYDAMRQMIMAIESGHATPIVRVPPGDDYQVGRALDAGAKGLIIPLINSADDVRNAVKAAAYGPDGLRSFGPMRALTRHGVAEFHKAQNDCVLLPQIETAESLDHLAEIVRVPGIDGVYVGPMDLAIALGLEPALDSDEKIFVQALEHIVSECRSAGIAAAIHANATLAAKRAEQGFTMITVATDISILGQGFALSLKDDS